ncbi:hypothetical protein K8I61_03015 [bacterium]|nr:hypothetical protein [bacterium]
MFSKQSQEILALAVAGQFDALSIGFYVILAMIGLVVLLGLGLTIFRRLPLLLFESWPPLIGIGLGAMAYFRGHGWLGAGVCVVGGVIAGWLWSAMLDAQQKRKGPLGRARSRLLKHASK